MTHRSKIVAVTAGIWVAGLVQPAVGHGIILDIPDFSVAGGETVEFVYQIDDPDPGLVDIIYFTGDYSNDAKDGSWASDLQLTFTGPGGASLVVGGFDRLADADLPWGFQGEESENSGQYITLFNGGFDPLPPPAGEWTFSFTNDRSLSGLHEWSDVEIWLIPTPTPGPSGLAVLLLGLIGNPRRRRGV